jgi:hypothetical protein
MTPSERKERFDALHRIGCICCRIHYQAWSEPVIHHLIGLNSTRRGLGGKSDDAETIGLCPRHHDRHGHGISLHDGVKTWEAKYWTQMELLAMTNEMIEAAR